MRAFLAMHRYFGRETVFTLFTNIGSVGGCCFAVLAGTAFSEGKLHGPAMMTAWASLFVSISGLVGTVGSQVVNILKVIKDHEVTTSEIASDLNKLKNYLDNVAVDVKLLKIKEIEK